MRIMWFNLFLYVLYCSSQDLLGDLINFFIKPILAGVNQGDLNLFIILFAFDAFYRPGRRRQIASSIHLRIYRRIH